MTVSNEDREPTWELDQEALERVLHDLDRIRAAFAQDYVNRRIEIRHDGDFTDAQIDKFRHNGGLVWDANYLSLAQLLKYRSSLISHGWGPRQRVERKEIERHIYHAALAAGTDLVATKVFDAIVSAAVGAVMVAGIEVSND